jgi:hypothetical protein
MANNTRTGNEGFYQFSILGSPKEGEISQLCETIQELIAPFGLGIGSGVNLLSAEDCLTRAPKSAFAAVYFGRPNPSPASLEAINTLIRENLPIIPVVGDLREFSSNVPPALRAANGMALGAAGPKLERLATAVLECLGLLRRQRRVFLSYRRAESAQAALQLHEALGSDGFDVFLDTFAVRPGEDFQSVLWSRLCDSDVMVMLDTPGYFGGRWTAAEIGRALAKKIAVLGVVWPDHQPQRLSQLREPIFLEKTDLLGADGPLTPGVIDRIRISVERLRSRSLAIRHASIAGALRSATEEIGGSVEAVGAHRAIKIVLADGRRLHAFPAVGVPTAESFHEVAKYSEGSQFGETGPAPVLVYDHVGLHERWQRHLDWLHENLHVVKSLQITQAAWQLADWGAEMPNSAIFLSASVPDPRRSPKYFSTADPIQTWPTPPGSSSFLVNTR